MRPTPWRATLERVRLSLFFVPSLFVAAGIVIGQLSIEIDASSGFTDNLPFTVSSTVASARAVLSTIAGATITVAGIAFSISLLVLQLASTQYSPRVIHGLFRDPVNKLAIGIVVGTFTFCLVVLRSVRSPTGPGDADVPNLSVALAVVFGIGSILAVIAFINHNAHAVEVSEILEVITKQTVESVESTWRSLDEDEHEDSPAIASLVDAVARGPGLVVAFERSGWIQHVDADRIAGAAGDGGVARIEVITGRYAIAGTALCSMWSAEPDLECDAHSARAAVTLGSARTLSQDPTYGVRQLADVAIKALSPGVNDPTTAQDAIFHLGAVLREFLRRRPPRRVQVCARGAVVLLPESPDHKSVIDLACDELRLAAAPHPAVCSYLLEMLRLVHDSLEHPVADKLAPLLRDHARRVVAAAARAAPGRDEVENLRRQLAASFEPDVERSGLARPSTRDAGDFR